MAPTNLPPVVDTKQRNVDVLQAAWRKSSDNLTQHSNCYNNRSFDGSQATLWTPTTYEPKTRQPPNGQSHDPNFTPVSPTEWNGDAELASFDAVTLRDGRVAERDPSSGKWKWRSSWAAAGDDDNESVWRINEKKYSNAYESMMRYEGTYKSASSAASVHDVPLEPPPQAAPTTDIQFSQSSTAHEVAFVICVCLAQFLALGGLAQTVAPLPIIGDYLGVSDAGKLSWYTAAYSLTVGTFILPAGRIGDMFGHKRVYITGWIWFCAWSVITGFSYKSGSVVFTICRAFQGMGPAFIVPNAMALIGITFPVGKKRNIIFALFGAMGPTGFVCGSVFSAMFAQVAFWPWGFWTLGMVCALIAGFSYLIIPAATKKSPLTITGKFDFAGAITGVSGLILINFAWNQAPLFGWSDILIPILLVVGIAIMAVFVFIEMKVAEAPLIPIRDISKEGFLALACIAAGWGSHGIWLYYFFLFVENLRGHSPLAAAAQICPVAITGVVFALSTGILVKKIKVAYIMCLAMFGFLFGLILLVVAPINQTYWGLTFVSVLLTPLGMNLSFPAGTILLSNALPCEKQGVAASLVSTMVNYSISTGLGIAGTVDRYVTAGHADPTGVAAKLSGYRSAWGLGMGLDILGLAISAYFIWTSWSKTP